MNTWPNGQRRALTQCEHERFNASNYPGTRELCCECDEPTGNCEEDNLFIDEQGPLCEECFDELNVSKGREHDNG